MKTRNFIVMISALGWLILMTACEKETTSCPTCSDEVSWNYYGRWRLRETGYDGLLRSNSTSTHLEQLFLTKVGKALQKKG